MPENLSTLYKDGDSRYHRLHPFSKLIYILLTATAVYLGPGTIFSAAFFICLNMCIAAYSGVLPHLWKALWRTMLPLIIFMTCIHGLFHPDRHTLLFSMGPVLVFSEGLIFSGKILLQLAAALSSSLLFAFCTHPADLVTAVCQAGWPPTLAYLLGSPLLLLPSMRERARTIQAAQIARGMEIKGSLFHRFKALPSLVAPLVLGALVEVEHRSIALETRSFSAPGKRTAWRVLHDSTFQHAIRWIMATAILLILLYRLIENGSA